MPIITGEGDFNHRDSIFSTYHGAQFGLYSQRMVRTEQWKYIWNPTDIDELYDLENDPAELNNLASSRAHLEVLKALKRRLACWLKETSDPLLNPWNKYFFE